jgi:transcription elongation factor SPT5
VGDHVKAVSGRFEGEAGLVLRVEDSVAVVLSDQTSKEIKASPLSLSLSLCLSLYIFICYFSY